MSYVIGRVHKDAVQAFLERTAPEERSADNLQVVMRAALIGDVAALTVLLDRGADPGLCDSSGRTPLMETAFSGHTEALTLLLERGADPNAADTAGWTALMEAASKGHTETVRTLLLFGANPAYTNSKGWNALRATPRTHVEIIHLLKEAGAD